jgi:hypothetical protein
MITLMMEAVRTSETLVYVKETTWLSILAAVRTCKLSVFTLFSRIILFFHKEDK